MKLTAKQERFAQSIADGMNQSDAYRAAYDAKGMKDGSVNVQASKMMADPKIALRVDELRKALEEKGLWTREKSVQALANIAEASESKAAEIVAAVKELNSMHGYNAPVKSDVTVRGGLVLIPAKNA